MDVFSFEQLRLIVNIDAEAGIPLRVLHCNEPSVEGEQG
jgi:hypothetical protein